MVTPAYGSINGGARVTITGQGFVDVSAVRFGAVSGRRLHVVSPSKLEVTSPPHKAGSVELVVVTKAGRSKSSRGLEFTYARVGTLSIFAGIPGSTGKPTPGSARKSHLDRPSGVAVDRSGDVYIADTVNSVVEKVTPSGTLSIFAGIPGSQGLPKPGPATSSDLGSPTGVAVDSGGNVYISDGANDVVEKVTPSGTLSIFAGIPGQVVGPPTPGPATSSYLDFPADVAVDGSGDVYIADSGNAVVEKVTPSGTLSIFASGLNDPTGVAVGGDGSVYIADYMGNNAVDKVTPSGTLSGVAGVTRITVTAVAVDGNGNVYVSVASGKNGGTCAVEKVTPAGKASVFAGIVTCPGGLPMPGPATSSPMHPSGLALDSNGNLYITDTSVVEKVSQP